MFVPVLDVDAIEQAAVDVVSTLLLHARIDYLMSCPQSKIVPKVAEAVEQSQRVLRAHEVTETQLRSHTYLLWQAWTDVVQLADGCDPRGGAPRTQLVAALGRCATQLASHLLNPASVPAAV